MSFPFRSTAKRIAERGLRTALAPVRLRSLRERALILAYHNVVPDNWAGGGDRSLHLSHADFIAQLDILQATHDIVPLGTLVESTASSHTRPRAAITFDDAYSGAVNVGLPELARRGLPATVFVTPGFLGGRAFWWDELALPEGGLDPEVRAAALETLGGDDRVVRTWAAARRAPVHPAAPEARASAIDEIEAAMRAGFVTLGAHTWSHPNLTRADDERLARELTEPFTWLQERFGPSMVPFLAYPYGRFDGRVIRAAAAAGYKAAFAIVGGWVPAPIENPLAIPRVNIPAGISANGFALRSAGVLL
ncbi:MAG TPA: polysaccharide deacetylase family protein [Candidatus Saccharimonadales bacterium]|nr:polysaccharide deacetylase family protein [Candidatus Saccharimonadales bacterium]